MNNAEKIIKIIRQSEAARSRLIIAIDGECASGKSTLANDIYKLTKCNIIHMDDFFLTPELRTAERENTPGGNIDYERFMNEVMLPLTQDRPFSYRPYICTAQAFGEEINITPEAVTVIEGVYSCHPALWDFYDLRIFLTADKITRLRRIQTRNGDGALKTFIGKWIPMEDLYFSEFKIKERCDVVLKN